MKIKFLLYFAIFLLITGIVLRQFDILYSLSVGLMITGALGKIAYILIKYRRGEYKPGYELIALYLGLILFFTGLFLKVNQAHLPYGVFMALGISLKVLFVLLFIRKVRS